MTVCIDVLVFGGCLNCVILVLTCCCLSLKVFNHVVFVLCDCFNSFVCLFVGCFDFVVLFLFYTIMCFVCLLLVVFDLC